MAKEKDIVDAAVEQLNKHTNLGAKLTFLERDPTKNLTKNTAKAVDGQLTLPKTKTTLNIECKKWINKANLPRLILQMKAYDPDLQTMLVTDYVNPNLAEQLKKQDIQFIDTAGNAFINQPPVYIDIQGKKPAKPHQDVTLTKQMGKAFQPKGMKVVYMLLTQPELINAPMRTIADTAEVALGTVKQVMDDLHYQGFIIQKGEKGKVVADTNALLDKWLDAYPENMQAKLNQTLFAADNPEQLKAIDAGDYGGLWGGELAAERYAHYLNAKDFLIYLAPDQKQAFLKAARLRKPAINEMQDHKVMVVEPPFENKKIQGEQAGLAHPLLVYASLITSTDPRNMDAAKRLYDEYLA
ncbi:type IV toxin-antitoxin system AbiEi family antitoxin [Aliiglaciecola sp. M165]|uniref:type IV toxin-antitoxin system AbiEi family antitoxin n=1 Tax=Aliiglaciecola sp. M165 TaxID=2593649 RepID=UPI00163D9182|nr:type IV toxin-antitoxin system AbiEi family antitoxin [Aliiglaciecola sp. M165]